ncbi:MAG: hypothetical protein ACYS3N_08865 [Planctomycetota bacterium]|jgi:hypothetical protein
MRIQFVIIYFFIGKVKKKVTALLKINEGGDISTRNKCKQGPIEPVFHIPLPYEVTGMD